MHYLAELKKNPGVIGITVMPAMPKITGKARMAAKNRPGYLSTMVRVK